MTTPPQTDSVRAYDPRWFVWTMVFLVVAGIALVSYILFSDSGTNDVPPAVSRSQAAKSQATTTPTTIQPSISR